MTEAERAKWVWSLFQGDLRWPWVWCQLWTCGSDSGKVLVASSLWSGGQGLLSLRMSMIQVVPKAHKCLTELLLSCPEGWHCVLGRKFKLPVVEGTGYCRWATMPGLTGYLKSVLRPFSSLFCPFRWACTNFEFTLFLNPACSWKIHTTFFY